MRARHLAPAALALVLAVPGAAAADPVHAADPGAVAREARAWRAGHEREVIGELADASTPPWSEVRPAW